MDIHSFEPFFKNWYIKEEVKKGTGLYVISRDSDLSILRHFHLENAKDKTIDDAKEKFEKLKGLRSEGFVDYYEFNCIKSGSTQDYFCRTGNDTPLCKYIAEKKVTNIDIIRMGIDICRGLTDCEINNVNFGIITENNIFVSEDGRFKLGGFELTEGLYKRLNDAVYAAPEVYTEKKRSKLADIYSLAMVMYILLNNRKEPFVKEDDPTEFDRKTAVETRIKGEHLFAPSLAGGRLTEILFKALSFKPEDRYQSASEFSKDLNNILYRETAAKLPYSGLLAEAEHEELRPDIPNPTLFVEDDDADVTKNQIIVEKTPEPSTTSASNNIQQSPNNTDKKKYIIPAAIGVCALIGVIALASGSGNKKDDNTEPVSEQDIISEENTTQKAAEIATESALSKANEEAATESDTKPSDNVQQNDDNAEEQTQEDVSVDNANDEDARSDNTHTSDNSNNETLKEETPRNDTPAVSENRPTPVPEPHEDTPAAPEPAEQHNNDDIPSVQAEAAKPDYTLSASGELTIPKTRKTIEAYEFRARNDINSVYVNEGIESIKDGAFTSCSSLKTVTLPSGLKTLGDGTFMGCSSLSAIKLPADVNVLNDNTFSGCSSLSSVSLPYNLQQIGSYAFRKCSSLTEVNIPGGTTRISGGAFSDCSSLKRITIPESVTFIGNDTFSGCPDVTVICKPGTEAEKYAKNHSIKYENN